MEESKCITEEVAEQKWSSSSPLGQKLGRIFKSYRRGIITDAEALHLLCDVGNHVEELHVRRLAAISTAAMGYFKKGEPCEHALASAALHDTQELYAKYEALYKQNS